MKKLLYLPLVSLLFACGSQPAEQADTEPPKPPNVVIILADDMGYSDIGSFGSEIPTPALDGLASNGLRMTNFYNAARCCPTRAALLTGLYPHQAGMGKMVSHLESTPQPGPYQGYLPDSCLTIAGALKQQGYRTFMSGKWHVGEKPEHWPRQRGFDRYFGLISGASSYYQLRKDQPRTRQMVHNDSLWQPPAEGFYMTDAISDTAVQFVNNHLSSENGQPFLLYLAYTAPHWPLHAPEQEVELHKGRYDSGWDSLRESRFRRMRQTGLLTANHRLSERPDDIPAWEQAEDKARWSRMMEVYAAMITRMDKGIGRLVQALEEQGELDNTLIIFISDNGGCHESIEGRQLNDPSVPIGARGSYVAYDRPWANASNTPFRWYKSYVHEGGVASPFVAHWPLKITNGGSISREAGHVIDLMPTVLQAAGVNYEQLVAGKDCPRLPGKSLLPVFSGGTLGERTLAWEHFDSKAIRQGDWKLVANKHSQQWELYDLSEDPSELNNLAGSMSEKVRQMEASYEAWAQEVGVYAEGI